MILLVVGVTLLVLGLFAGSVLVLAPLGLVPWSAAPLLWVFFPLFSGLGYVLFVIGAKALQIRWLSLVVSCLLLMLALASATALVLDAASVIHPVAGMQSLWFVLVVAGLLGTIGVAARNPVAPIQGSAGA